MSHRTSERVYALVKADVLEGRCSSAGRLNVARLAHSHGASVTPVREALMRLVGETLVEMNHVGGFNLPLLSASTLSEAYELNLALLFAAIGRQLTRPGRAVRPNGQLTVTDAAALFTIVADNTGNKALIGAVRSQNDRLSRARLAEVTTLSHIDEELVALVRAYAEADGGFRRRLRSYHFRRLRFAAAIAAATMSAAGAD